VYLAWREKNRERIRAQHRAWDKAHPEFCREKQRRRVARQRGAAVAPVSYERVLRRDGYVCHLCHDAVASEEVSFDHVMPLARGGSHTEDNIKVAHTVCNLRKGTRTLEELALVSG
jgi:5-methylcytosine-specific restriction endonuclease McrA